MECKDQEECTFYIRKTERQDPGMLYLRVAAAADHSTPLGPVHTARMLDQVIVCSADVGVFVACYRPVHIMKDGIFVTVQVVLFKPLPGATKERPQTHLRVLFAKRVVNAIIYI